MNKNPVYIIYANQVFEINEYIIRKDKYEWIQESNGRCHCRWFNSKLEALEELEESLDFSLRCCREDLQKEYLNE